MQSSWASGRWGAAWASVRDPTLSFLSQRVPLWLSVWWGMLMVGTTVRTTPNLFLDGWFRWDALYYLQIAERGYTNVPNALLQRDTNFWPLFPFLSRLVSLAVPGHDLRLAMFVLNNAMLLGSLVLFRDVGERAVGKERTQLASWLLLCHPFAFYYSAGYTESAFLFFSLVALYFGERERWLVAGLAAACASATRAPGIGTTVMLAVLYLEKRGWSVRRIRPDALFVALGGLGALEYVALLQVEFHDPFAFMAGVYAKDWGADITLERFFRTLGHAVDPVHHWPLGWIEATDLFHVACLALVVAMAVRGVKVVRPHLVAFCAIEVLIVSRIWSAGGRYSAPIFPVYLVLADLLEARPAWKPVVFATFASFQALFAFMYSHSYWVS
jgi:hypothetical protein